MPTLLDFHDLSGCDCLTARAIMPAAPRTTRRTACSGDTRRGLWRSRRSSPPSWRPVTRASRTVQPLPRRAGSRARPYDVRLHDAWLAAAAGNARVVEPRLTGGFAYGPAPDAGPASASASASGPAPRHAANPPASPSSQLYAAAAKLQALANADPAADHLRALGVAYLLIGSRRRSPRRTRTGPCRGARRSARAVRSVGRACSRAAAPPRTPGMPSARSIMPNAPGGSRRRCRKRPSTRRSRANACTCAPKRAKPGSPCSNWSLDAPGPPKRLHTSPRSRPTCPAWPGHASKPISSRASMLAASDRRLRVDGPRSGGSASGGTGTALDAGDLARRFPQAIREYLQEELLPVVGRRLAQW